MTESFKIYTRGRGGAGFLALGDHVVLSASLRDLHRAYPGRFHFSVAGPFPDLFKASPDVSARAAPGAKPLLVRYGDGLRKANRVPTHFMGAFLEDLNAKLRTQAVLTEFRPALYLTPEEEAARPLPEPYWLFASGGKRDMPAKKWSPESWNALARLLDGKVRLVQVGAGRDDHPRIPGTTDMVGRTSVRDLMRLVRHADGVICGITSLAHIAAAFNRPAVIIAGGREPRTWESYDRETRALTMERWNPGWRPPDPDPFVPQTFLHTLGRLDCCRDGGCWKSGVMPDHPRRCLRPLPLGNTFLPECMSLITPEQVAEAVLAYASPEAPADIRLANVYPADVFPAPTTGVQVQLAYRSGDLAWLRECATRCAGVPTLVLGSVPDREAASLCLELGLRWVCGRQGSPLPLCPSPVLIRLGAPFLPREGALAALAGLAGLGQVVGLVNRIRLADSALPFLPDGGRGVARDPFLAGRRIVYSPDPRFFAAPAVILARFGWGGPKYPAEAADAMLGALAGAFGVPVRDAGGLAERFEEPK